MSNAPPSTGTALFALARLAYVRATRGALIAVALIIACMPVAFAAAVKSHNVVKAAMLVELLVLAILPALFVAPAIGEEIEDRTAAYLWSRPLPRWSILAGKLIALAPLCVAIVVGSWIAAGYAGAHELMPPRTIAAMAAGTLAICAAVAGVAVILPKHGMAFAIIYILLVDLPVGQIPASIQLISLTQATRTLAGLTDASVTTGVLTLLVIGGLWLALAFRRISKLEI